MFVPAIHSGTISSILGMTLKISHRTVKKLLKCWGVLWSLRYKFFFFLTFSLYLVNELHKVSATFEHLAWQWEDGAGAGINMTTMKICIIKVHLRSVSNCLQCTYPTGPFTLNCQGYSRWLVSPSLGDHRKWNNVTTCSSCIYSCSHFMHVKGSDLTNN